jgi:hypothetical protein
MSLFDLTVNQLKRAAAIKEQIDKLNKELGSILGPPATSGAAPNRKRTMSASVKKKIAAAQKARWAKFRRAKQAARSVKPRQKKKTMSPAARAKLSAKLKAQKGGKK